MSQPTIVIRLKALAPRNALAVLARLRRGGAHKCGNQRQRGKKDLVQQLREAGAI